MNDSVLRSEPSVEIVSDEAEQVIDRTKAVEALVPIASPSTSDAATATPQSSRNVSPFIHDEVAKGPDEVDTIDSFESLPEPSFIPRGPPKSMTTIKKPPLPSPPPPPRPADGR